MSYKENYALIDWSKPIEIERKPKLPPARSALPCPMIMSDIMDPVEHPCTGEFMTSRRGFRKVTRANGCIEVGDDPARKVRKPKPDKDKAISDSIDRAFARAGI